jgi:hypothetical protein
MCDVLMPIFLYLCGGRYGESESYALSAYFIYTFTAPTSPSYVFYYWNWVCDVARSYGDNARVTASVVWTVVAAARAQEGPAGSEAADARLVAAL